MKEAIGFGILIRLSLFFSLPNLSDDFYRFIWDGNLIQNGIHPFSVTPDQLMSLNLQVGQNQVIYDSLNSQRYFTIYPPISQFIFWISTFSSQVLTNVNILRIIILFFEIGTFILLKFFFNPSKKGSVLAIYALNPLVILELTGNLHFEGIMLFFLLLSIVAIQKQKWIITSISLASGIGVKLIPLMFLPVLVRKIGQKHSLLVYALCSVILIIIALPLLNVQLINGMSDSLYLFFNKFEFNAGFFFLLKEMGLAIFGFDIIHIVGPLLPLLALIIILSISFFKVNSDTDLTKVFSLILLIQLFLSTIVHPWYIIPLIALAVSTGYRFPIVWSFLIFFTYIGYELTGYKDPLIVIWIEYLAVGYLATREIFYGHKTEITNG
ncbi:MAG: hypothetical protein JXR07_00175 [Reichenbachiella sp.]